MSEHPESPLPFVSVVIPVHNDPRIRVCLDALLVQTYPKDRYEVIVVDNGSTDGTRNLVRRYPVRLLVEDGVRSSYVARNRGVLSGEGQVIAFLDSDCRPVPHWIEQGVQALEGMGADLAGGHVRFVHSTRPSSAQIFDSLNHMQQGRDIRDRQVAKTANLFVRTRVFDAIGMFPSVESGGDVYLTRRATDHGLTLVFARHAEVSHPTRGLGSLLKKAYRVGRGRYDRYVLELEDSAHDTGRLRRTNSGVSIRDYRPPKWSGLRRSLARNRMELSSPRLLRVWLAGWLYRTVMALGSTNRWAQRRLGASPAPQRSSRPSTG